MKHKGIVEQLLAAHALSGCDSVENIYGIGKGKIIKKLQEGKQLLLLGLVDVSMDSIISEATRFIGSCYVKESFDTTTDVRFHFWSTLTGKHKAVLAPPLKTLPPTTEAFAEHVKRAHLQCAIWRSAMEPTGPTLDPLQYGWCYDSSTKALVAAKVPTGTEVAPPQVLQMIKCGCGKSPLCSYKCNCASSNLSCTVFCGCLGEGNCQNPATRLKNLTAEEPDDDFTDEDNPDDEDPDDE